MYLVWLRVLMDIICVLGIAGYRCYLPITSLPCLEVRVLLVWWDKGFFPYVSLKYVCGGFVCVVPQVKESQRSALMGNSVFLTDRGLVQPLASSSVRVARLCPPRNASVSFVLKSWKHSMPPESLWYFAIIQMYICHVSFPVSHNQSHNQSSYGPLKII